MAAQTGAVSQQPRALPAAQPLSADDVNPQCLHPPRCRWLLRPEQQQQAGGKNANTAATASASVTGDRGVAEAHCAWWPHTAGVRRIPHDNSRQPSVSTSSSPAQQVNLKQMTVQQLARHARSHNAARNIPQMPLHTAMDGLAQAMPPVPDELRAYPYTVGGQPRWTTATKAWRQLARGRASAGGARMEAAAQVNSAPGSAEHVDKKPQMTPPTAAAAGMPALYGALTKDQQDFKAALFNWMDMPDPGKLPLLAPGTPALDLKLLLTSVLGKGGYAAMSDAGWQAISEALLDRRDLHSVLRAVYAHYLLPAEQLMLGAGTRRSVALTDWLNSKATERSKVAYCESGLRPTPGAVQRAAAAAEQQLSSWQASHGNCDAVPRLALRLARQAARDPHGFANSSTLLRTQPDLIIEQQVHCLHTAPAPAAAASAQQGAGIASTSSPRASPRQLARVSRAPKRRKPPGPVAGKGSAATLIKQEPSVLTSQEGEKVAVSSGHTDAAAGGSAAITTPVKEEQQSAGQAGKPAAAKPAVSSEPATQPEVICIDLTDDDIDLTADTDKLPVQSQPRDTATQQQQQQPTAVQQNPQSPVLCSAQLGATSTRIGSASRPASSTVSTPGDQHELEPDDAPMVGPFPDALRLHELSPCCQLLLSWRQLCSAPAGCGAPPVDLIQHFKDEFKQETGKEYIMPAGQHAVAKPTSSSARRLETTFKEAAAARVRRYLGTTPRCGACKTCQNPAMKQACTINRERIQEGQPPVVWNEKQKAYVPLESKPQS